jgi:hypothetical protein
MRGHERTGCFSRGAGGEGGVETKQANLWRLFFRIFFFFLKEEGWDRFVRGKGKLLGKYIDGKGVGL